MSLTKKFVNAVRMKAGYSPLIITTSSAMATVTADSPLLTLILRRDTTHQDRLPAYFRAVAQGYTAPEQQRWDVQVKVEGYPQEVVLRGVSYDRMRDFMLARELHNANPSGFAIEDSELIERRRKMVGPSNILHFVK